MTMKPIRRGEHRKRRSRVGKAAPILVVAAAVLSACGSTASASGSSKSTEATSGSSSASAKGVSIVVIGGASSDPFFSTVKNGVDAAAKIVEAAGGKVTYLEMPNYNNIGPDAAKLDQTALSLHPSAIVSTDWVPSAQDSTLKSITQAGIPLVIYNSGTLSGAKAVGALTYIGTDYTDSGKAGAKEFLASGGKDLIYVNTVPGDASAEDLGSGYSSVLTAAGAKYTELNLPATSFGNPTAVAQAIKSELLNNPQIDGIATFGAQDTDSAASAIQQANETGKVKLIGFNLSTNELDRIQNGTQLATVDQQPFAQGFYSVIAAFQYVAYGIELPTQPILTGPLIVDKQNVARAIAGTAAGAR